MKIRPNLTTEPVKNLQEKLSQLDNEKKSEALTIFCVVLGNALKDILRDEGQNIENIKEKKGSFLKKEKKHIRLDLNIKGMDEEVLDVVLGAVEFFVPDYKTTSLSQQIKRNKECNFNSFEDETIEVLNHDFGHSHDGDKNAKDSHFNLNIMTEVFGNLKMHLVI